MDDAPPPRLIAIGEAMMLVTPTHAEPLVAAETFRLDVAGAELNVARHVAHLGVPVAWVGAVGADALGERLKRAIRAPKLDLRWVAPDAAAPTGVYFKDPGAGVLYYRAGSAASRMGPESIADVPLESADLVHVSGITPSLSATCAELIESVFERVAGSGAQLSFDVNYRPALWEVSDAAPVLLELSRRADLVLVGLDEAQTLWGTETAEDVRALIPEPRRLVVKDGDVGATEFDGADQTFAPTTPTEVVEVVGAGDAFAAGYLVAAMRGAPAIDRLRAGHDRAALVLKSTSDFIDVSTHGGHA
ncbi:sugar kinase [Agromyces silvae]|uniref:sugar kinase n=1 Tax=Agromyces silvae TaxID=3388266 RepID=UPI00280BAA60|nr:sugar kinase [Agromyces protaetiae]